DALGANLVFVGGDTGQDVGDQPAGRGRQVEAVFERDEADLPGDQGLKESGETTGGAAQPIEAPDHDLGDPAGVEVGGQLLPAGAIHRAASSLVAIPTDTLAGGIRSQPALQVGFLTT